MKGDTVFLNRVSAHVAYSNQKMYEYNLYFIWPENGHSRVQIEKGKGEGKHLIVDESIIIGRTSKKENEPEHILQVSTSQIGKSLTSYQNKLLIPPTPNDLFQKDFFHLEKLTT